MAIDCCHKNDKDIQETWKKRQRYTDNIPQHPTLSVGTSSAKKAAIQTRYNNTKLIVSLTLECLKKEIPKLDFSLYVERFKFVNPFDRCSSQGL